MNVFNSGRNFKIYLKLSFHWIFLYLKSAKYLLPILLLTATVGFAQKHKNGHININIIDNATRQLVPVRVRLTQNNIPVQLLPEAAIAVMYGHWDHADGYGFQPDSSFYINGNF